MHIGDNERAKKKRKQPRYVLSNDFLRHFLSLFYAPGGHPSRLLSTKEKEIERVEDDRNCDSDDRI